MVTIYTHSQTFHPDELLAIALLQSTVLRGLRTSIVRTRDPEVLKTAQADAAAFVIDVGFVYDPQSLNFDHHQKTMSRVWADGTPYSACGLIWSWLREQGALDTWGATDLLDAFEAALVIPADKHDNGIGAPWPAGDFIAAYNRSAKGQKQASAAFNRALQVATDLIDNVRLDVGKDIEAKRRMQRALAEPIHAEGLVVIEEMRAHRFSYWAARLGGGVVDIVLTRRADGQWNLTTTPAVLDDPFSTQCPAPPDWRGQAGLMLQTQAGPAEIVFCHKSGYLTVVDGTLEQAIAVAQLIRQFNHSKQ
jgi:uncharacterized UPF0160 family protein